MGYGGTFVDSLLCHAPGCTNPLKIPRLYQGVGIILRIVFRGMNILYPSDNIGRLANF